MALILALVTGCSKGSKDNAGSDSGNQVSDNKECDIEVRRVDDSRRISTPTVLERLL